MEQDNIYRVLLELKETAGRTEANIEDIKQTLVNQSIQHDKLNEKHELLQKSHDSYKGKVLLVSGGFGALISGIVAYIKTKFFN